MGFSFSIPMIIDSFIGSSVAFIMLIIFCLGALGLCGLTKIFIKVISKDSKVPSPRKLKVLLF